MLVTKQKPLIKISESSQKTTITLHDRITHDFSQFKRIEKIKASIDRMKAVKLSEWKRVGDLMTKEFYRTPFAQECALQIAIKHISMAYPKEYSQAQIKVAAILLLQECDQ